MVIGEVEYQWNKEQNAKPKALNNNTILNLWKPIPREGEVTGAATKAAREISPSD